MKLASYRLKKCTKSLFSPGKLNITGTPNPDQAIDNTLNKTGENDKKPQM